MVKIGIRAHDIGRMDPFVLADRAKAFGFDGVQLVLKKALPENTDFQNLDLIAQAFSDIGILMLGAYFNPVHPDNHVVQEGISYFKDQLQIADELGIPYVGSETGSLMGSPWGYLPENHSDESLELVVEVFRDLVRFAEEYVCSVALEGAFAHVVYSPERVRQVLDKIGSRSLKVTVDLFNFLHIGNYQERMEIFDKCFALLRDEIVIFHLKDFVVENDQLVQVGLGKGLMDFPAIIKKIKSETPDVFLIFEGVTGSDISDSYALISKLVKE